MEKLSFPRGVLAFAILPVIFFIGPAKMEDSCTKYSCPTFPEEFMFGTATAAYQVEGGWNEDGRGPCVWDTLIHNQPDVIKDKSSGDVGPDSYHLYREDVRRLKELGVDFYRFSISWSRILPNGDISSLNPAGVKYYSDLIDLLIEEGIQPMITMFHLDLPQYLEDMGGPTNSLFVKYFREYARVLFDNYAHRVKLWSTFNEPLMYSTSAYGTGDFAPMKKMHGVAEYLVAYNILLAHAEVYHLYREQYYGKFKGKLGITLSAQGILRKTHGNDLEERGWQFQLGIFANPIFSKEGGWPKIVQETIDENSKKEGRAWSRLPTFTEEQIERIKGTADFFGFNYFTGRFVESGITTNSQTSPLDPSWERDMNLTFAVDDTWKRGKSDWLYLVPEGLRNSLFWIRDTYDNPEVLITENGWSDSGEIEDDDRVECLRVHLRIVQEAIEKGCRVKAYSHWSLIDNFEWMMGYTEKFGLYRVDMEDAEKKRIEKKSAKVYREIIKNRKVM